MKKQNNKMNQKNFMQFLEGLSLEEVVVKILETLYAEGFYEDIDYPEGLEEGFSAQGKLILPPGGILCLKADGARHDIQDHFFNAFSKTFEPTLLGEIDAETNILARDKPKISSQEEFLELLYEESAVMADLVWEPEFDGDESLLEEFLIEQNYFADYKKGEIYWADHPLKEVFRQDKRYAY